MSDVSNFTPLTSPLTINPFHQLKIDAINILRAEGRFYNLAGREMEIKHILDSDTFSELYDKVENLKGESVNSFKTQIKNIINCNLRAKGLSTPDNPVTQYCMCRDAACENRCAAYLARTKKVKYPANISAIKLMNNPKDARDLAHKIHHEAKELEMPWIKAVDTPLHDGRSMVRVINLRLEEMHPFGDNDVRETYNEFMTLYPDFDPTTIVSNDTDYEVKYLTNSGFEFNSTQLWTSRKVGRKGTYKNEGGAEKGWEFDSELNEMVYMTEDERKKKRRKENGIKGYLNVPVLNTNGLSLEETEEIVLAGIESQALSGEKAVFSASEYDSVNHTTVGMMQAMQDAATSMGFHQDTSLYIDVPIYEDKYENFINTLSTGTSRLPENILEIEFTEEMITMGPHVFNLKQRRQIIHNMTLFKAQQVLINAPTKKELANKIARYYLKLE